MEASSSKQNGAYSGNDRLSDLSDCVLHTILSHLKARQVVPTCLLSRRWRHLWLSAPSADIDSREFRSVDELQGGQDHEFGKFEDMVDSLLFHHSTSLLHTLRLRIVSDGQTSGCMPRWIRRALNCAPAVLVIHYGGSIVLPPRASGTRRLTKLCLDQVSLHYGFQQQITTGLPVLEDLRFRNSDLGTISRIESGTLKSLTIDCCRNTGPSSLINHILVVAAPRLTSLHFVLMFTDRASFIMAETPSLVQASICLVKKPKQKSMFTYLSKLLGSLFTSSVSSLKLAGFQNILVGEKHSVFPAPYLEEIPRASRAVWNMVHIGTYAFCPMLQWILEEEPGTLPLFPNLRTLMLDNCEAGGNIQVLRCFLHNAPVLEMLALNNCRFSVRRIGNSLLKPLSSNTSDVPPGLRLLEIRYTDKDDHELRHQGTRPINEVLSIIRAKLDATTMIQATKVPRKRRAN